MPIFILEYCSYNYIPFGLLYTVGITAPPPASKGSGKMGIYLAFPCPILIDEKAC